MATRKMKTKILGIVLLGLLALLVSGCRAREAVPEETAETVTEEPWALHPYIGSNVMTAHFHQGDYYFIEGDYTGAYDIQYCEAPKGGLAGLNGEYVFNYDDYCAFCEKWNIARSFSDTFRTYLVYAFQVDSGDIIEARLADVTYENDTATLYYWNTEAFYGPGTGAKGYAIIVPTEKETEILQTKMLFSMNAYEEMAKEEKIYSETGADPEPE